MKKTAIAILVSLLTFPVVAQVHLIKKTGTMLRVEKNEYTYCYFQADGEKEEMALWPAETIDCGQFVQKQVHVVIRPEKLKIAGNYGTLDVLKLIEIK